MQIKNKSKLLSEATSAYFICTTPRSGSNLLSTLLCQTNVAGYPEEHFWRNEKRGYEVSWNKSQLGSIIKNGSTDNGIFGTKLILGPMLFEHLCHQICGASAEICRRDPHSELASAFSGVKYVHLARRNKVRQAISWYRALCSNHWIRLQSSSSSHETLNEKYDFSKIDYLVQEIIRRELYFSDYCKRFSILPYNVLYEDLVVSPAKIVADLFQYLGAASSSLHFSIQPVTVQQADDLTDEWVKRYLNDRFPNDKQFDWLS